MDLLLHLNIFIVLMLFNTVKKYENSNIIKYENSNIIKHENSNIIKYENSYIIKSLT